MQDDSIMIKAKFIDVLYTHTEGMETCIIASGIPYPRGSTLLESVA